MTGNCNSHEVCEDNVPICKAETLECGECSDDDCSVFSTETQFYSCGSSGKCIKCQENCLICTSETNCLTCIEDYVIATGGVCVPEGATELPTFTLNKTATPGIVHVIFTRPVEFDKDLDEYFNVYINGATGYSI